jgi:hypothetical protein
MTWESGEVVLILAKATNGKHHLLPASCSSVNTPTLLPGQLMRVTLLETSGQDYIHQNVPAGYPASNHSSNAFKKNSWGLVVTAISGMVCFHACM